MLVSSMVQFSKPTFHGGMLDSSRKQNNVQAIGATVTFGTTIYMLM